MARKLLNHKEVLEKAKQGYKNKDIAALMDIQPETVTRILKRYEFDKKELDTFKAAKVDILADLQRRVLTSITDEQIEKMNAYQKVMIASIVIDKERLLRGESTSNNAVLFQIVSEACKSNSNE